MSQTPHSFTNRLPDTQTYPTSTYQDPNSQLVESYNQQEKLVETKNIDSSAYEQGQTYEEIIIQGLQNYTHQNNTFHQINHQEIQQYQGGNNPYQSEPNSDNNNSSIQQEFQNDRIKPTQSLNNNQKVEQYNQMQEGEIRLQNNDFYETNPTGVIHNQVKEQDEGYNNISIVENQNQPILEESGINQHSNSQVKQLQQNQHEKPNEEEKSSQLVERYQHDIKENKLQENQQVQQRQQQSNEQQQKIQLQTNNNTQPITPLSNNYNSYLQAVLNTPTNMAAQPTDSELQQIHQELKAMMAPYKPEQIYILLYNNLIKAPRESLIEAQAKEYNPAIKYDGGHKYWAEVTNPNNKSEMSNFELRKQIIKVYVTKGYGLKVFQDYLKSLNPQAPQIDKEKFKKHFVEIYKITIRKVQDFLTNTADRQFEPLKKQEYQKPLSDVINCKKHYSPQFCEVFYRILQATFDTSFQRVPNEEEVIFFYKTIVEKLKGTEIKMVTKLRQPQEQKDPDIWTREFEQIFLKYYIQEKNLGRAKSRLIEAYPQCEGFITNEKIRSKVQNGIRIGIRYLSIQNRNCGNSIQFEPSDMQRRFIMQSGNLEQSRIKLLKVYLVRPTDSQVLGNIVGFIHEELRRQYEREKVGEEVVRRAEGRMMERGEEMVGLERLLKGQLMRNC